MKKNESQILKLEFENLLEYLKTGLFEYYIENGNEFVEDAMKIKITQRQLDNMAKLYESDVKVSDSQTIMMESLKTENSHLAERVKQLEKNLTFVNQEHVDLANELIQTKVNYTKLKEGNEVLSRQVAELRNMVMHERNSWETREREVISREEDEKVSYISQSP
jgi:predicted  nucleic acid-binding Zn-ribbon protein